jgi:hypothetical protein
MRINLCACHWYVEARWSYGLPQVYVLQTTLSDFLVRFVWKCSIILGSHSDAEVG